MFSARSHSRSVSKFRNHFRRNEIGAVVAADRSLDLRFADFRFARKTVEPLKFRLRSSEVEEQSNLFAGHFEIRE